MEFHHNSIQQRSLPKEKGEDKMTMKLNTATIALVLLLASAAEMCEGGGGGGGATFDVTKHGAKADGKTDNTKAFLATWNAACSSASPATVMIPSGVYLVDQISFEGPCKAKIAMTVHGTLKAPVNTQKWNPIKGWVTFNRIDGFTLSGNGVFDGNGPAVWGKKCKNPGYCKNLPMNLRFNYVSNAMVKDITSKDSKQFHVNVIGCKNLSFYHFTASAPGDSDNTDGIHVGRSQGINITNCNLQTGDDCLSIGDGTKDMFVNKVNCGPGHGISIGSLGLYQHEEPVSNIRVTSCTLTETLNGLRIKTYPASPPGTATGIHFEDIIMNNVANPIIVDQEYCPWNECKQNVPSRVKLSDISYKNVRGTTSTPLAVKLICSPAAPCQNVKLQDINLKSNSGKATTLCKHVKPILSGKIIPALSCSG